MTFEQASYLTLLLVILPVMATFFIWRGQIRRSAMTALGNPELITLLTSQVSPKRRFLKSLLWMVSLAALIIALAGPTQGNEVEIIQTLGVQVMFVLDVSESMNAQDVLPSRLRRAKLDMSLLMDDLEGNNFGITLFTTIARPYLPMTFDTQAAKIFLDAVTTRAISQQGTAIGAALRQAQQSFIEYADTERHIVLLTDGENHEDDALEAARLLVNTDVTLHVLAYGSTQGALIPMYDTDNRLIDYKTFQGGLVESRLNEDLLQRIAELSEGNYINILNASPQDLRTLASDINSSQRGALTEQIILRPVSAASLFLLITILLLGFEIVLPDARLLEPNT